MGLIDAGGDEQEATRRSGGDSNSGSATATTSEEEIHDAIGSGNVEIGVDEDTGRATERIGGQGSGDDTRTEEQADDVTVGVIGSARSQLSEPSLVSRRSPAVRSRRRSWAAKTSVATCGPFGRTRRGRPPDVVSVRRRSPQCGQ